MNTSTRYCRCTQPSNLLVTRSHPVCPSHQSSNLYLEPSPSQRFKIPALQVRRLSSFEFDASALSSLTLKTLSNITLQPFEANTNDSNLTIQRSHRLKLFSAGTSQDNCHEVLSNLYIAMRLRVCRDGAMPEPFHTHPSS